ncbi:hypothetical protein [Phyllobacterium sp. K27]
MLTEWLGAIEGIAFVGQIRSSTFVYAAINGLHILGLSLLVGAVLTFDLRASGLWKSTRWREGLEVAIPVAGAGLGLAIVTGSLLFAVRGTHYASLPVFAAKMAFLMLGMINILVCHAFIRRCQTERPSGPVRICGALSAAIWLGVLFTGRWIAFST